MRQMDTILGCVNSELEHDNYWCKKIAELHAINLTIRSHRFGEPGPRNTFAISLGLMVGSVVMAGLAVSSNKIEPWLFIGIPAAVFVWTYLLSRWYSKKPLTHLAKLDGQLAIYDPLNREAYRQLQSRTRQCGALEPKFVLEWLKEEQSVVEFAANPDKSKTKGAITFLDRKI